MPSLARLKRLKSKLKKKKLTTKQSDASSKRKQDSASKQDSSIGKIQSDPQKISKSERDDAIESLNGEIESAKNLPPAEAGILLRAAYFLRLVLLELSGQGSDSKQENGEEKKEAGAADLKKALADFTKAKDNVKDTTVAAGEGSIAAVQALKKKPQDMTPDEISQAITEVEKAIEAGKALPPADASLLQRVLYALRMALLELGGVDPKLAVKDKEKLEELIAAKIRDSAPDPTTKNNLTKAVDDVNRVQAHIANQNLAQ